MTVKVRWRNRCIERKAIMRRFFFLQNSPVDCFVKPKELTELETGRSQFVRAGVQRVQPFVHGYRECNTPVQVKGGSLAQLSGVSPLSTGYYLTQKAARNQLRCPSPLSGKSKRRRNSCEINKAQWTSRKEWRL